jgi:uncharacterized membrane protein
MWEKWHLPNEIPRLSTEIHRTNMMNIPCYRYTGHIQAIRNNNGSAGYSNHIWNTEHTYETITDTMDIIKTEKKEKHLNILEKYHIRRLSRK